MKQPNPNPGIHRSSWRQALSTNDPRRTRDRTSCRPHPGTCRQDKRRSRQSLGCKMSQWHMLLKQCDNCLTKTFMQAWKQDIHVPLDSGTSDSIPTSSNIHNISHKSSNNRLHVSANSGLIPMKNHDYLTARKRRIRRYCSLFTNNLGVVQLQRLVSQRPSVQIHTAASHVLNEAVLQNGELFVGAVEHLVRRQ